MGEVNLLELNGQRQYFFYSDQMRFCNDILWFDIWQKDSLTFCKLTISFRFNSSNEKNNLN